MSDFFYCQDHPLPHLTTPPPLPHSSPPLTKFSGSAYEMAQTDSKSMSIKLLLETLHVDSLLVVQDSSLKFAQFVSVKLCKDRILLLIFLVIISLGRQLGNLSAKQFSIYYLTSLPYPLLLDE